MLLLTWVLSTYRPESWVSTPWVCGGHLEVEFVEGLGIEQGIEGSWVVFFFYNFGTKEGFQAGLGGNSLRCKVDFI
jgi:hypothetical protein